MKAEDRSHWLEPSPPIDVDGVDEPDIALEPEPAEEPEPADGVQQPAQSAMIRE